MNKTLGVAVIHGMGSQRSKAFADPLIEELESRLERPANVAWRRIFWADVLSARQDRYLKAANRNNQLDFFTLRSFVISALGDASAYRRVGDDAEGTYGGIHTIVRDEVAALRQELGGDEAPLVILAHSLGGHVISNYIWDIQKQNAIVEPGDNDFERMRTLAGLVTFGCNIPLFTFALNKIVPISLPQGAKWLNFFDPDDVLGYPLKPLSPEYRRTVSRDIAINVGGIASSWNPLSHSKYWTDNDFTKPVARFLDRLIE
jgi:pimeloyl-ACP methyl ester carboxylesterase